MADRIMTWRFPEPRQAFCQASSLFVVSAGQPALPAAPNPPGPEAVHTCPQSIIDPLVKARRAGMDYCYKKVSSRRPRLTGSVSLQWEIDPNGRVVRPKITRWSFDMRTAAECMVRQLQRWQFSKPPVGTCRAQAVFDFEPPP
jgi:hypothetical protein